MKAFIILATAATLVLSGCGKNEDVSSSSSDPEQAIGTTGESSAEKAPDQAATTGLKLKEVRIGHTLDEQKRVADNNTEFTTKDSVYVSVETTGTGSSDIKVTYKALEANEEDKLEETHQKLEANGPAVAEFQIYHNGGWKPGTYEAEIFIDGDSVATKQFTVK